MNNKELKKSADNVLNNNLFIEQLQTLFYVADLEDDHEQRMCLGKLLLKTELEEAKKAQICFSLGTACYYQKDLDQAMQFHKKGMELDPRDAINTLRRRHC